MKFDAEQSALLQRARNNDTVARDQLFQLHRQRLKRMVALRIHPRLVSRIDASDVVQEAYVEATKRLDEFLRDEPLPFFLWLRHITGQKLIDLHRRHLGAQARDARREIQPGKTAMPPVSCDSVAAQLIGHNTSPSRAAMRAELKTRVNNVLERMDAVDREVLVLRHFEQLSNAETAQVLGLSESASSKRYIRALERLDVMVGEISNLV